MAKDEEGRLSKASNQNQQKAFRIARSTMARIRSRPYSHILLNPIIYGTFIKCCGRLNIPDGLATSSATRAFQDCCAAGLVNDFVLKQLRYTLQPASFLAVLAENGYTDINRKGKSLSRDGKRIRHIRLGELPEEWTRNVDR